MRARFGNRLPAVKLVAGLLILAVTVGLLQALGTTSATADHAAGAGQDPAPPIASAAAVKPRPAHTTKSLPAHADKRRPVHAAKARPVKAVKRRHTVHDVRTAVSCKPTTAIAARARKGQERPEFIVRRHASLALAGKRVAINGKLKDACAGVRVRLQQRSGHGWRALATTRVGRRGGFHLAYEAPAAGTAGLRVAFGGGHGLRRATESVGAVTSMHPAVASWYYDDTGATGCGFQATYGVANKTLPCGTKVTLSYGGRTVVATVDDRGPYIPGRTYDLGIHTRDALGMNGVVTLLASA